MVFKTSILDFVPETNLGFSDFRTVLNFEVYALGYNVAFFRYYVFIFSQLLDKYPYYFFVDRQFIKILGMFVYFPGSSH